MNTFIKPITCDEAIKLTGKLEKKCIQLIIG